MTTTTTKRCPTKGASPHRSGITLTQAERRERGTKLVVSLSLSPAAIAEVDSQRGDMSRSAYVEWLVTR